jgi:hypothetical protein
MSETSTRRDWNLDVDGELDGLYVETRAVTIKNGPSAGQTKAVLDLHVGIDDELVTLWPSTVARRKLADELGRRGHTDFEPGERLRFTRKGKKQGANGPYNDDDVWFENASPAPTAAAMLGADQEPAAEQPTADAGISAETADDPSRQGEPVPFNEFPEGF